jgi:hypothetical protein
VLGAMPPMLAGAMVRSMADTVATPVLSCMEPPAASKMLQRMPDDESAALVASLPPRVQARIRGEPELPDESTAALPTTATHVVAAGECSAGHSCTSRSPCPRCCCQPPLLTASLSREPNSGKAESVLVRETDHGTTCRVSQHPPLSPTPQLATRV